MRGRRTGHQGAPLSRPLCRSDRAFGYRARQGLQLPPRRHQPAYRSGAAFGRVGRAVAAPPTDRCNLRERDLAPRYHQRARTAQTARGAPGRGHDRARHQRATVRAPCLDAGRYPAPLGRFRVELDSRIVQRRCLRSQPRMRVRPRGTTDRAAGGRVCRVAPSDRSAVDRNVGAVGGGIAPPAIDPLRHRNSATRSLPVCRRSKP